MHPRMQFVLLATRAHKPWDFHSYIFNEIFLTLSISEKKKLVIKQDLVKSKLIQFNFRQLRHLD